MGRDERLQAKIKDVETHLANSGRVLVRPSGTESLIRVMIEAETEELCNKYASELVEVIKEITS